MQPNVPISRVRSLVWTTASQAPPARPQPTLAPLEASERNRSNKFKELSPPHAHSPKKSQSPKLQSPWCHSGSEPDRPGAGDRGRTGSNQPGPPLPLVKEVTHIAPPHA
eukprot:scaffold11797_cov123-Isochrysis_galbana.AAC.2